MPNLKTEPIGSGNQSWLGSTHAIYNTRSVAPDPALFTLALYPTGVPSGTPIGIVTATGLAGPYSSRTDEVQTVTVGGAGLTSFTLTFSGQTTAAIAAAATAATVQAALEALSNIAVGDVVVTGAAGGVWTVTFAGNLADTDVAQMTSTPTGGTGTVTVATTVAGGAAAATNGREILAGFLYTDQRAGANGSWPLLDHGRIRLNKLPAAVNPNAAGFTTTGQFVFIGQGV